jgi:hypothetical protein
VASNGTVQLAADAQPIAQTHRDVALSGGGLSA